MDLALHLLHVHPCFDSQIPIYNRYCSSLYHHVRLILVYQALCLAFLLDNNTIPTNELIRLVRETLREEGG